MGRGKKICGLMGRGMRYVRTYGGARLYRKIRERRLQNRTERHYPRWLLGKQPGTEEKRAQREWGREQKTKFSILVPAYETPPEFLRQMVESVCSQTYENWELCIADGSLSGQVEEVLKPYLKKDSRIRYERLKENLGISRNTNAALSMASGEYVGLLDHDDILFPQALYQIAKAVEAHPRAECFYTDEDKVSFDRKQHFQPHFKPDFNLELLRSNNYICHFFVAKRALAQKAGGFREEFDGAQDHDFIFRCVEGAREVVHIPEILYSWRCHASSTASDPESKLYAYEAGKRAVEAHLKRQGVEAKVFHTANYGFYRVRYRLRSCAASELEAWEKGLLRKSFEKCNGQNGIKVVYYGKICNKIVIFPQKTATDKYILFTCVKKGRPGKDFLRELVSVCERQETGIACARVYGADGRLSHPVEMEGVHNPFFQTMEGLKEGYLGYFHRACLQQETARVTDCFLMRGEVYARLVGENRKDGEELVSLSLERLSAQVRRMGYRIVYNPWAVLYERK